MSEATLYDVFLSHNSQDKPLVEQIAQRLVDEAKLRPFLDQWHLIPGESWQEKLPKAIGQSSTVAAFIGPSGNGPWHHEEMQLALMQAVREKKEFRVIPVLLPEADAHSIPAFLQLRTGSISAPRRTTPSPSSVWSRAFSGRLVIRSSKESRCRPTPRRIVG
jgi:hypothetical protein